jgi:hypothetical protein
MEDRLWGWKAILGIVAVGLLVVTAGALTWQLLRLLDNAKQALVAPQGDSGVLPLAKQWLDRESAPQAPLVPGSDLAVPAASPTPSPRLALDPNLPSAIAELARAWADQHDIAIAEESAADIGLNLMPSPDARMVTERILVPTQRFPSLREGTALDELRRAWTEPDADPRLLMTQGTASDLTRLWGATAGAVSLVSAEELTERLWEDGDAVGIVPFERLEPRVIPLDLDGLSAVDNRLEQQAWPLTLRVWLHGSGAEAESLFARLRESVASTNRDPEKLTVLVMTGVTAMSRMTALRMEQLGDYAYPAHVIGSELAAADITHISNEVPLVPGCEADPTLDNVVLCSKPEYLAALEEVGADIVGLTGNHQNDFGPEAMVESLEIYAQQGLRVYGAGANDDEAREALTVEHNGNRLAFLGANEFGPPGAWATGYSPGSARFDLDIMRADIAAVRPLVDVVLVELQYTEFNASGEYQTEPLPQQRADFEALSAAGAHIVTGVQAHRPQATGFGPNGILLFGLGNLFFDQMNWWETRQGLIGRHAIYNGRHISTELLVTILEDWAQPRWATPEERREVLTTIFTASGW